MGQIDDGIVQHITDLLAPWARVSARRMFGGCGVYRGALMFGLISDEQVYLKHGIALTEAAAGEKLEDFTYEKTVPPKTKTGKATKKKVSLSYALVPAQVLEDSQLLARWAEAAWQDALVGQRLKAAGNPHAPNGRPQRRRKA